MENMIKDIKKRMKKRTIEGSNVFKRVIEKISDIPDKIVSLIITISCSLLAIGTVWLFAYFLSLVSAWAIFPVIFSGVVVFCLFCVLTWLSANEFMKK